MSERGAPFELLEWKLAPPRPGAGSVPRTALLARLGATRPQPVTVIRAGPGWGKTTLLAQWARSSPQPFVWVTLGEGDNDPIVLLAYVATALARVTPVDPAVFAALASPGASIEATILPRLGAALAAGAGPFVLVLDDLHTLHHRASLDAVATLARYARDAAQLVVAGRSPSILWEGAGPRGNRVRELGQEDLRMDQEEARQLFEGAGVSLPAEQVAGLVEQAEGWPAGLALATLSIRAQPDRHRAAAQFSGNSRAVAEYLRPQLLAHLSPADLRFLTHTAILSHLSGALCDAVLEQRGSSAVLAELVHSNQFVVPLDASGEWFRYHHLFRELLLSELERSEPESVAPLLARASAWCEANGRPDEAIGYAQRAGDVGRVGALVGRGALLAYRSGRVATVTQWLDWLEERGGLEHNAPVAALGGLMATLWGQPAKSARLAELAESGSANGGSPPADPREPQPLLLVLRALRCASGVECMRADAERAVAASEPHGPVRPTAALVLAISLWLTGDAEAADKLLPVAADEGSELRAPETSILALAERAAIAIGRGAWVDGEEHTDRALGLIKRWHATEHPSNVLVCALAARVALHQGRPERAAELLGWAQRLRPQLTHALPHVAVQARVELGRAYLAVSDAGGAHTVLREADAILRRRPDLGILNAEVEGLRESLLSVRSDLTAASTLSAAELRLLPALATPFSFREIGETRHLSRHTVKSQAMSIYRKLGVSTRSDAVARAHELGLL